MRKLLLLLMLVSALVMPVAGMEFTAPTAPDGAQELLPVETADFGQDLLVVVKNALAALQPDLVAAARTCLTVIAVVMLVSVLRRISDKAERSVIFAGVVAVGAILLKESNTLINLGAETVTQISEYGKLLLPVLTAAMAAQGGGVASAALYAGTAVFDTVLTSLISVLLVPMVYMFLALAVANSATGENMLKGIRDFVKWLLTWLLKTILYIFTGYMAITGVVSGSADAAAIKATKLTISGMVPVVGGILSDASEAVIVGAGVMKNAVGVYGVLAFVAMLISPFLKIGVQYLLLKLTASVCAVLDVKELSGLVEAFSTAMGLLLGMTGAVCMLQLISTVCYMKGFI